MMRRLVRLIGLLIPMPARDRWREEWCAELDEVRRARGRRAAIRMSAGALRDAVTMRRVVRDGLRRSFNPFRGLANDLRDVQRSLVHSGWFAASVVASLGLGIAGIVTAFTFVNGLLFRPFPGVRAQDDLVRVRMTANTGHIGVHVGSLDDYLLIRDGLTTLSGLAAQATGDIAVRIDGRAEAIRAAMVSGNYFDVLGVTPAAGRFFSPDPQQDRDGVVVITHSAWAGRFGSRPDIVGTFVELGAYGHARIIGVAPAGVVGASRSDVGLGGSPVEMWLPIDVGRRVLPPPGPGRVSRGADPEGDRDFVFTGRLAPGVTRASAQREADVVAARLAARPDRAGAAIRLEPVTWGHAEQRVAFAAAVLAVPALVLVIGCVNAAHLLLARGTQRTRERAVRIALGASRWRVVRPMLLESLLLALLAVAGSLPIAQWAMSFVRAFIDLPMPIDARVVAFAMILATCSTIVFALLPSLRLSAASPGAALGASRDGDAAPGRARGRRLMVVAQVAVSAGLLATGGQLLAFLPAQLPSSGTPSDRLLFMTLDTSQVRMNDDESSRFYSRVLARVSSSPEADGVGLARPTAVWTFGWTRGYSQIVVWHQNDTPRDGTYAVGGYAGGELFRATGQRLVAGRLFDASDLGGRARTAIVNRPLAEKLFPGGAVGQVMRIGPGNRRHADSTEVTIVGVVEPVSEPTYSTKPVGAAYVPVPLEPEPRLVLYGRARNDTPALAAVMRDAVRIENARLPAIEIDTLEGLAHERLFPERLAAGGVSLLGLVGLLLAAGGVYATMAYFVSLRAKEIGIRLALGAAPSAILRMTLSEALRLAAWGAAVGAVGAYITSKLVQSEMRGVPSLDPALFAAAFALLGTALVAASLLPARRAARVDPIVTLRQE
jgi:predicted permease